MNIWNENGTKAHTLNEHQGAVKALAWCPWQSNLLATGGEFKHVMTIMMMMMMVTNIMMTLISRFHSSHF